MNSADYWDSSVVAKGALRTAWDEDGDGIEECLAILVPWLSPHLLLGARMLDLGCGSGRLMRPLQSILGCKIVGIDFSRQMVVEGMKQGNLDMLQYFVNDGENIPTYFSPLDAAYSVLMFQHVPADIARGYVRQVAHLLATGGAFVYQYAPGTEDVPYSHQTHELQTWCEEAHLEPVEYLVDHARGWAWTKVVKR